MKINRRQFIQGATAAGAASLMGGFPQVSQAATVNGKRSTLLLIMMNGGYAPIQTSAHKFLGNTDEQMHFGIKDNPIDNRGDVHFDVSTWGQLPEKALSRLACIGSVGASNHNSAKHFWEGPQGGLPQALASAMGGNSAIKAAKVGNVTGAPGGSVGGVSLESVKDMDSGLRTLTGAGQIITRDERPIMGRVVEESFKRFQSAAEKNPDNLSSLIDGYQNLVKSMTTPSASVDADEIKAAYSGSYQLYTDLGIAEALLRSGVNVVCIGEGRGTYWDTHDDNDGSRTRAYFDLMIGPLSVFFNRMLDRDDMNLTVVFVSEHSRIPLINNHGPHLSTIVFGDNVNGGVSTGETDNGGLVLGVEDKPVIAWKAAIGEMVGLSGATNPFGAAEVHRPVMKYPPA